MLYTEFLSGTEQQDSEGMKYAYDVINHLYSTDKLTSKEDAYNYFNKNKLDFTWVNGQEMKSYIEGSWQSVYYEGLYIGYKKIIQKEKNLVTVINEDRAKNIINQEFCFELDKIIICGSAYFEAWDFNHMYILYHGISFVYSRDDMIGLHVVPTGFMLSTI